jgi:hypothetical protein
MKVSILLIVAIVGCAVAAPVPSSPSICDKYVNAQNNGNAVIGAIVDQTITNIVGSALKRFFDGSIPGTTNFVGNATALNILKTHLVQFFGQAALLNCTDGSIGAYQGNPDMAAVHQKFQISLADSNLFNQLLISAAAAVGVDAGDADKVRIMLGTVRYQICNTGSTCNPGSFCDKYSIALNLTNNGLVGAVVDGTVGLVTTNSLKKFFDGSIPGTVNFLDPNNAAALATLRLHLIQFFGQQGVLDCTDQSIGAYVGKTMKDAHAKLPITLADFNLFNANVISVMKGAGVAQADLDAAQKILDSTKGDICNQPDCNPAATLFFSAFLLFAALLLTLF